MAKSCCTPASSKAQGAPVPAQITPVRNTDGAVPIPGGHAMLGTTTPFIPDDGESPPRTAQLKPFLMAATTVTNAQFAAFVQATGYVTEAEHFGWSFVFWSDVPEGDLTRGVVGHEWWRRVDGADWRNINGAETGDAYHPDHPVVHVSWRDAAAYAKWVGGRLPSEAEWEHAARGGHADVKYPWGNADPDDTDYFPCNIWQGPFPRHNTCRDGFKTTAPAQSFAPNDYGLYNMVGNVWEWTAEPFKIKSLKKSVKTRLAQMKTYKLLKGGSFLCHRSYCYRYRIAARSGNSPESTTTHQGFRVVWDPAP